MDYTSGHAKEDRRLMLICRENAKRHGYIALFIIWAHVLLTAVIMSIYSAPFHGTVHDVLVGISIFFYALEFAFLIPATIQKRRHDVSKRFVLAWYARHPEDRPRSKRAIAEETHRPRETRSNWEEDLRRLKKLLDDGVLTQEEFERKKREILTRQF